MPLSPADAASLARVRLLRSLSEADRARLAAYCDGARYDTGQVILWEGHHHQKLFLVIEGEVVVSKAVRGEVESVLAHLSAGAHFGELALVDGEEAAATVTAETPAQVVTIDAEALRRLLREDTDLFARFAWALMGDLVGKIRATNEKVAAVVSWGLDAASYDPDA